MERYISIKEVLDNLLDNPLLQDLTLERVVNYTIDFIRKVGMPKVYIEKTANLPIITVPPASRIVFETIYPNPLFPPYI